MLECTSAALCLALAEQKRHADNRLACVVLLLQPMGHPNAAKSPHLEAGQHAFKLKKHHIPKTWVTNNNNNNNCAFQLMMS